MRVVVKVIVSHVDDDGYSVGKSGRAELDIPLELVPQLADEIEPGGKRAKKKDRDRIALGIEALVRAWMDVYRKGDGIYHYHWYKDLPIVREFAKHFVKSPASQ